MAEQVDLKHRVSRASIGALGAHIGAFDDGFDRKSFVRRATKGLEGLQLKARIKHIAEALAEALPDDFAEAASIIEGANALALSRADPPVGDDCDAPVDATFVFWPLCTFVEHYGLADVDRALATMHGLTSLASCEFAIRPYIEQDTKKVYSQLRCWTKDPDHHVRRLVSEGTRPLLPWGPRLRALQRDPSPNLALLDELFDDEQPYVRRSVANHLNDISKDHPDLAVETARRWKRSNSSADVAWVIRHALRSLVKQGHAGALALQGIGAPKIERVNFSTSPGRLRFGNSLKLKLELRAKSHQSLLIDYAVHHMKANGTLSPKVFKWKRADVMKGEVLTLEKRHAIRTISTRRYYPGVHRVELLINGRSLATQDFKLVAVP